MGWKKKEKELTEKEALQQARIDLAPRWYRSSPLLAAVPHDDKTLIMPLESHFAQSHWLICFSDPTTLTGQTAIQLAKVWNQRYTGHHVKTLCIQEVDFELQRERLFLERIAEEFELLSPMLLDKKREFMKGFGIDGLALPRFVFWSGGQVVWQAGFEENHRSLELRIQHFLRSLDKGLPLPHPWNPSQPFPQERATLTLGTAATAAQKHLREECQFRLSGQWQETHDHLRTQDPEATVQFLAPGSCVAMLARSVSETIGETRVLVEINDAPVYESVSAGELVFTESGDGSVGVETFRLYRLLHHLPEDLRRVTLRFPLAKRVPVGIYSINFYSLEPGSDSTSKV